MFLKKHFFSITIFILFVLAFSASFLRFYVQGDYLVKKNEIECDPYTELCFEWCEEEVCEEPYYYAYATRNAQELRDACGIDINDCDAAWYCDPSEINCEITYCDPDFNDCDDLDFNDAPLEANDVSELSI
jgi:hypothetical protein